MAGSRSFGRVRAILAERMAREHPEWSPARIAAEITKAAIGIGPHAETYFGEPKSGKPRDRMRAKDQNERRRRRWKRP